MQITSLARVLRDMTSENKKNVIKNFVGWLVIFKADTCLGSRINWTVPKLYGTQSFIITLSYLLA